MSWHSCDPRLCARCTVSVCGVTRAAYYAPHALRAYRWCTLYVQLKRNTTNTPAGGKSAPWVLAGGTDGRTHDLRRHERSAHAAPDAKATAVQCESSRAGTLHMSAASMPGQPPQLPVYSSLLHSGTGQSHVEHGSSGQSGRSVGLVGKTRPVPYPASPSQRPARPRAPWLHILHWPWAEVPRRRRA